MDESPVPHAEAAAGCLQQVVRDEIAAAGGWIRFSRFMELALYAPGLGYYSAGAVKVGASTVDGSDFVTAPELTPLFARALARPVADVLAAGGDTILELGGGSGRLAVDLLAELERVGRLPARYLLLDVSADLRERQQGAIRAALPHLIGRVAWIDRLPAAIDGVVIGNEVLDALPVELVARQADGWASRGVTWADEHFVHADRPLPDDVKDALDAVGPTLWDAPPGYLTELHPAACGLVASIVERLSPRSVALWIDYGFPASEYYHPQRAAGTLMAHRAHRATSDLLSDVGLSDLTAHVDFTAVAAAAVAAGGCVVGYTNQASFLLDCGITELVGRPDPADPAWIRQISALQTLLSEAEMGELFKVIALGRQPQRLTGFRRSDRRVALAQPCET